VTIPDLPAVPRAQARTTSMRFIVIETFRNQNAKAVSVLVAPGKDAGAARADEL
jgi:hypothetical protein